MIFTKIKRELLKFAQLSKFQIFKGYCDNYIKENKLFGYSHFHSNSFFDFDKQDLIFLFLFSNADSFDSIKDFKESLKSEHIDKGELDPKYLNLNIFQSVIKNTFDKLLKIIQNLNESQLNSIPLINIYFVILKAKANFDILKSKTKNIEFDMNQLNSLPKELITINLLSKAIEMTDDFKKVQNFYFSNFSKNRIEGNYASLKEDISFFLYLYEDKYKNLFGMATEFKDSFINTLIYRNEISIGKELTKHIYDLNINVCKKIFNSPMYIMINQILKPFYQEKYSDILNSHRDFILKYYNDYNMIHMISNKILKKIKIIFNPGKNHYLYDMSDFINY